MCFHGQVPFLEAFVHEKAHFHGQEERSVMPQSLHNSSLNLARLRNISEIWSVLFEITQKLQPMKAVAAYESPQMEIFEILAEGVLCMSDDSGVDLNPEEGYM